MYSKEENQKFRIEFWTKFGQFMKLIPVEGEEKKNWINYKTGLSFVRFKMDVDRKEAKIAIEISKKSANVHLQIYQKFEMLRTILQTYLPEDWIWNYRALQEDGRYLSRIETSLENVSVNRPTDWPSIMTFFKERMLALDSFWTDNKELFDEFKPV